ncbi:MAG TPA: efflux RND transporter periplasmic adaptor subunit, partial [Gemmatales bacterium]|nr:efflux RND transporter periplasmic adaptor subunit [Gemmatales bacterium]
MTHTPRRSLFTALLVVGGLAATFVLARHWLLASPTSEPQPTPRAAAAALAVRLAPVQRGTVSATLELTGNFLPRRRTLVVAEVDGVIKRISYSSRRVEAEVEGRKYSEKLRLDLGQPVAQGEVLIELDPTEYELELAAAKARLEKTQKDLEDLLAWRRPEEIRRLKAMRAEAVARLERAEADLKRTEALIRQQATSPQLYDQALAELRAATAGVDRADADLAEAEAGPTAAQVAVARALVAQVEADVRIREDRLRKTVIRAPYDAVISERFVEEGERVTSQPRVELLEIIDLSLVLVQVGVPERYLGRVAIGGKVQVTAAGSVDPVPGLVFLMNEKVDHETRTFRVRVAVENHER